MATIDLGKVAFVWKGTYASGTTYESKDVVQYTDSGETSSYIYVNASSASGQTPSTSGTVNTTYWAKMAGGTSLAVGNNKIVTTDASGNVSSLALGSASQALKVNSGATGFEFSDVTSAIRKLTMFNDATYNISVPSASVSFPITLDFVKAQADSDIFIQGWTPSSVQASYRIGERMRIQKVSGSAFDDGAGGNNAPTNEIYGGNNYMSAPSGSGGDDVKGIIHWSRRIDTSTETFFNSAETYRVHLGWASRNGSAQQAGSTWNTQNSSARDRQSSTVIWVWELDPSTTAFIT